MKKKLFTFLLCAFAWIGANAYTVTVNSDGSVTVDGGQWVESSIKDSYDVTHTVVSAAPGATGIPASFNADDLAKLENATKIIITGYVENLQGFQGKTWTNVTSVDMSEAHFKQDLSSVYTVTYNKPIYNESDKSITTQEVTRSYMKNTMNFSYFSALTEAKLSKYVESICANEKCFDGNSALTTTFEIPASVKYIGTHACDNTPITNLVIPATVEFIDEQAFMNANIKALIAIEVKGLTAAKNGAFDRINTVGQTDAGYVSYTIITYPSGYDSYFHNSEHTLDQATTLDKGLFQKWLGDHLTKAETCSNPNGWKEFINSSSTPPTPVPAGEKVVLRTYSDSYARLVPIDFRAYIVSGVTSETVDGKTNYTLVLQEVFGIPAYTGVILYGEIDQRATSFNMSTIPTWSPGGNNYEPPYNRFSPSITFNDADNHPKTVSTKNYLVPSVDKTIKMYPVYKDAHMWDEIESKWNGATATSNWDYYSSVWPLTGDMKSHSNKETTVTDRNFIMSKLMKTTLKDKVPADIQSDDYVGFFRVQGGVELGNMKAYLSLPADVFDSPAGAEALVVKPEGEHAFRSDKWNLGTVDGKWSGNWGERKQIGVLQAKFAGEIFIEETGIQEISGKTIVDNSYYTLEGVRVAQPNKDGIYVKNGKKVIIKKL